jgi:hypothetical protein
MGHPLSKEPHVRKLILKFGLISGAILSAVMLATMPFHDQLGDRYGMLIGYTSMLLAFLFVYFGVRAWREKAGGFITFGQAFRVGIAIAGIGCACYVTTWEVIYYTMMPDFAEKYAAHQIERARAAGAPEAVIAQKQKEMADFTRMFENPLYNVGMTFLEPLPVALLMTLLAAGLLRRRPGLVAPA